MKGIAVWVVSNVPSDQLKGKAPDFTEPWKNTAI